MDASCDTESNVPLIPTQRTAEEGRTRGRGAIPAGPLSLLAQANTCREQAQLAGTSAERYVEAHLAAFRAATAVVLLRSPQRLSTRPASVWTLLNEIAPELREWSDYFAGLAERRATADAGGEIPEAESAELLARVGTFVRIAERSLVEVLS